MTENVNTKISFHLLILNVQLQTINKMIINIEISINFDRGVSSSHSKNLTVNSELYVHF